MADERVWLRHDYPDADPPQDPGYFHCPAGAAEAWKARGWVESDPPPPPMDPAVSSIVAWREEQERIGAEKAAQERAEKQAKRTRSARASAAAADGDKSEPPTPAPGVDEKE